MERLWAPWRLTYLERPRDGQECVFCSKPSQSDEEALIVHRGEHCYVVLNLYPYGSGHLMIVPFRHVADPGELDGPERAEFWDLLDRSLRALEKALSAEGHNVGLNLGGAAGAGIRGPPAPPRRAALARRRQLHARAGGRARHAAVPRGHAHGAGRRLALVKFSA